MTDSANGPKVALVTGGSRGIGAATVEVLRRDGFTVVLHYRSEHAAAQALADRLGGIDLVTGDLAVPGEADRVWTAALAVHGRIDVLVNNAGAWAASPLDDDDAWTSGWELNIALNLTAPAVLCRHAVEHFRTVGGGIIVNMTSRSAHRGDDPEHLAYGAAKGGLLALTRGIARGFAGDGVLAYAIAPGPVATDMGLADAHAAARAAALPMGEITPPSDVAEVVAFFASGRSPHSTGTTVDISGADYVR